MVKNNKRAIVGLVVAIAVGAGAVASATFIRMTSRAGSEATDNVRLIDDRKLPQQWAINAAYGRGALSNLRAAVSEIENHNTEEARKGIAVAQSLLMKIKPESANRTVKPTRSSLTVAADEGSQSAADLILVHSEVRVLGDADPANSVQVKLENIRHEFEMNDHEAIVTALESLNMPLAYTRIDLPLSETITLVNESLQALESQDAGEARSKLMQIGNGLRIETVQVGTGHSRLNPVYAGDAS
jgi:hypothetical protein